MNPLFCLLVLLVSSSIFADEDSFVESEVPEMQTLIADDYPTAAATGDFGYDPQVGFHIVDEREGLTFAEDEELSEKISLLSKVERIALNQALIECGFSLKSNESRQATVKALNVVRQSPKKCNPLRSQRTTLQKLGIVH